MLSQYSLSSASHEQVPARHIAPQSVNYIEGKRRTHGDRAVRDLVELPTVSVSTILDDAQEEAHTKP